jgi:hypothetical protein
MIAGRKKLEDPSMACRILSANSFEIAQYNNTYQQGKDQNGYPTNKLVKRDLLKNEKFTIDTLGKMVQVI